MSDYELIVIGAGPGGYEAALHASKHGLKTAVVEEDRAGGTCLNRGCVPTKTLLHAAEVYREAKEGARMGIRVPEISLELPALFAYKQEITDSLSGGVEKMLKSAKVDFLKGRGQITAAGCVCVTKEDGTKETHTAKHIIVATGAKPAKPPIPGLELPGVLTSDDILSGSDTLYESLAIIGGGVIGAELATFYATLGCQVSVIEGLDRLLPQMDRELGQGLAMLFKKSGISVYTGAMVDKVEESGDDRLAVCFTAKDKAQRVTAQKVLCAIGRVPSFDGVFANGLDIALDGRAIRVNERFETSISGVYAIGDVSSRIQLAHVATAQGIACVDMILGKDVSTDLRLVPGCVYTRPEIATVGMTEAQAKEAGISVKTGKCVMGANARTMIADPGRSFMKLVQDADSGRLIGAQIMCVNATDMISQLTEAVANGMTPAQLLKGMRPHPTFEEALGEALRTLTGAL